MSRFLVIVLLITSFYAPAMAQFTRGPYIQNLTQTSTEIMWGTPVGSTDSGILHYGFEPGVYDHSVSSTNNSGIHTATITGLTAGQTLYYYVESQGQTIGQGDANFHVRTAPAGNAAFRFAVYGDSQLNPDRHAEVVNLIGSNNPDLVLHQGDFCEFALFDGLTRFNTEFFTPAASLIRNTPFFSSRGNHDAWYSPQLYADLFDTPANNALGSELFYSFDYGAAHFISLDSPLLIWGPQVDPALVAAQNAWLEADLAANTKPWTFVFTHHPALSSGSDPSEEVLNAWAPLFEQYGVTMVFSGHDHIYDAYLMNGTYYFVTGGGGGTLDSENPQYLPAGPNPPYQICTDFTVGHHACFIDVTEQQVVFRGIDTEGRVFQTITLPEPGTLAFLMTAMGFILGRRRSK